MIRNRTTLPGAFAAALLAMMSSTALLAQGRWVESNAGLEGAKATAVAFDSSGGVLLGTDCGVYRWNGSSWSADPWFGPVTELHVMADGTELAITGGLRRRGPGETWGSPVIGIAYSVVLTGERTMLCAGYRNLARSTDRGRTWSVTEPFRGGGNVRRLERTPDGTVFAIGDSLWRSTDGGVAWEGRAVPPTAFGILPLSHDRWLAVSDSLLLSSDGGSTWRVVSSEPYTYLRRGADGSILGIIRPDRRWRVLPAGGWWAGVVELDSSGAVIDRVRPGLFDFVDRRGDGLMVTSTGADVVLGVGDEARLSNSGLGCSRLDTVAVARDGRMYSLMFGGPRPIPGTIQRGTLFRSDDSGRTWARTAMHGDQILGVLAGGEVFLRARNDTTGELELLVSRDGGATARALPVFGDDMRAFGDDRGTAAVVENRALPDTAGRFYAFTEAGLTVRSFAGFATGGVVADSIIVLIGSQGRSGVWRSTDLGETWDLRLEGPRQSALQRAPDGILYVLASSMLWRSTDTGVTWTRLTTLTGSARFPMLFGPAGALLMPAAVDDARLIRSDDGGYEWRLVPTPWRDSVKLTQTDDGQVVAYRMETTGLTVWSFGDGGDSWRTSVHEPLAGGEPFLAPWSEVFARRYPERLYRLDAVVSAVPWRTLPLVLELW